MDEISLHFEKLNQIKSNMLKIDLGCESLNVFGMAKINVHVVCVSLSTANKWVSILNKVFRGASVKVNRHVWYAKDNKGTCLLPTKREGHLVTVTY